MKATKGRMRQVLVDRAFARLPQARRRRSVETVKRDRRVAKLWLSRELERKA